MFKQKLEEKIREELEKMKDNDNGKGKGYDAQQAYLKGFNDCLGVVMFLSGKK